VARRCGSERELGAEVEALAAALAPEREWDVRMAALARLEGLLLGGAPQQHEQAFCGPMLRALRDPLLAQLADRRSAVVRQATHLLEALARALGPAMERFADKDAVTSMRLWLDLLPKVTATEVLEAYATRDTMMFRWQIFFQSYAAVIMPTLCDLPPPFDADLTLEGQRGLLDSLRVSVLAPLLGLPGLAVPVGSHGTLRTGVQIVTGRMREDIALDLGEVIEAAEGVVTPIEPV
jgi:Asp-tRNA(Asn)/Glu-tRNA(Gln) amidotransferase A subunit family amidase